MADIIPLDTIKNVSAEERIILNHAKIAATELREDKHGKRLYENWKLVGHGLRLIQKKCFEHLDISDTQNQAYSRFMSQWIDELDMRWIHEKTRAALLKCMSQEAEIDAWRAALSEDERAANNNPRIVWKNYSSHVAEVQKEIKLTDKLTEIEMDEDMDLAEKARAMSRASKQGRRYERRAQKGTTDDLDDFNSPYFLKELRDRIKNPKDRVNIIAQALELTKDDHYAMAVEHLRLYDPNLDLELHDGYEDIKLLDDWYDNLPDKDLDPLCFSAVRIETDKGGHGRYIKISKCDRGLGFYLDLRKILMQAPHAFSVTPPTLRRP